MRSVRVFFAACVAFVALPSLVVAPEAWGQPRRGRPAPSARCESGAQAVLDGLGGAVGACVLHTRGFRQGRVEVSVTLNGRGQVLTLRSEVRVNDADNDATRQCVEGAVRAAHFPGCPARQLSTIQRAWSFQATRR